MTEELIHDRISFREFLDIKLDDKIPDETTICKFRNKLIAKNLLSDIFDIVLSQMQQNRLVKTVDLIFQKLCLFCKI